MGNSLDWKRNSRSCSRRRRTKTFFCKCTTTVTIRRRPMLCGFRRIARQSCPGDAQSLRAVNFTEVALCCCADAWVLGIWLYLDVLCFMDLVIFVITSFVWILSSTFDITQTHCLILSQAQTKSQGFGGEYVNTHDWDIQTLTLVVAGEACFFRKSVGKSTRTRTDENQEQWPFLKVYLSNIASKLSFPKNRGTKSFVRALPTKMLRRNNKHDNEKGCVRVCEASPTCSFWGEAELKDWNRFGFCEPPFSVADGWMVRMPWKMRRRVTFLSTLRVPLF